MNALPIIVGALCLMAIAYRYYSAFIAAKVLALDDSRPVPSNTMYDGHNYYPTNKWVLFGHHFAAISGAGPLIGPVLAAQFGFLPGLLWLVIGVCLAGAVHDFMILGVVCLLFAVYIGGRIADSSLAQTFTLSRNTVIILMAAYGFIASVLPVWMLLCPRDYLSSYLKIGTIGLLILGVILVHPNLQMPALTPFTAGGGPVIPGKVYPFVFITIACGAISGFHSLVSSGTTPKMIKKETEARMIGYGGMLMEGVVGVVALIAATALFPGDYFAINTQQTTDAQKATYVRMVDDQTARGFNLQPQAIDHLQSEPAE